MQPSTHIDDEENLVFYDIEEFFNSINQSASKSNFTPHFLKGDIGKRIALPETEPKQREVSCQTEVASPGELPFPPLLSEIQAKEHVRRMEKRENKTQVALMEKYYGFADFELWVDRGRVGCTESQLLYKHYNQLQFKIFLYREIYNRLEEDRRKLTGSEESIAFELRKFREMGKDFYNFAERKNISSDVELESQLRARAKPHFELRDFKYSHNSLGRTNNDALLFRAYARNSHLKSIVDIVRDYIGRRYPDLRLKVSSIRHYERRNFQPMSYRRSDEWQHKYKRHYEEYAKNDSACRTGFTRIGYSDWTKKRSSKDYKDYRRQPEARSPSWSKRQCFGSGSGSFSYSPEKPSSPFKMKEVPLHHPEREDHFIKVPSPTSSSPLLPPLVNPEADMRTARSPGAKKLTEEQQTQPSSIAPPEEVPPAILTGFAELSEESDSSLEEGEIDDSSQGWEAERQRSIQEQIKMLGYI